jgi:hypothetical protein
MRVSRFESINHRTQVFEPPHRFADCFATTVTAGANENKVVSIIIGEPQVAVAIANGDHDTEVSVFQDTFIFGVLQSSGQQIIYICLDPLCTSFSFFLLRLSLPLLLLSPGLERLLSDRGGHRVSPFHFLFFWGSSLAVNC